MDGNEYAKLKYELILDGYAGYINSIDAEVASEYPCDLCEGQMWGEGFKKSSTYRAFAVCTQCGHAHEF